MLSKRLQREERWEERWERSGMGWVVNERWWPTGLAERVACCVCEGVAHSGPTPTWLIAAADSTKEAGGRRKS
mgnify:CR=1 FL=1